MSEHVADADHIFEQRPEALLHFSGEKRLPIIYQTESAECGLACLAMIAGYYGYETDLNSLRRRFSVSTQGMHLKHLADVAGQMDFTSRAIRADMEELDDLSLPCIIHWGVNHFVVLKKITANKYVIHDPASGARTISRSEFSNFFTGVLLELRPTQKFIAGKDTKKLKLSDFWSKITGLKRSLAQILFLSLALQLFGVAAPFYMQLVVDKVIGQANYSLLWVIASGFTLLFLVQLCVSALRDYIILYLSNRLSIQMAANLFFHLIRLPMDYFSKRHMGDIISRFGSLAQVRHLLTTGFVSALIDGLMTLVTLTAMFLYSVKLTFIVLIVVVVYALLRVVLYQPFRELNEERILASARENTHFMESVRAIQAIKIFQRENDRQNQWLNRLADVLNKDIKISRWSIGYGSINGFLFGMENIVVIFLAATTVIDGHMSLGMLYAFISFKSSFIRSVDSLISQAIEYKMLEIHLDRLSDITFAKAEEIAAHNILSTVSASDSNRIINDRTNSKNLDLKGKIEVKNLGFHYDGDDQYVFKNVSFTINAGETAAITGPSGCGKTTLLKCLMGLIQPTEGEILIDDKPIKSVTSYRSQIAGVMQDDQLVSGDIAENIAFFALNIDLNQVHKCAQLACIYEDILRMPMQFNSLIGDMGASLSGGQKQRIVLARALYREPRILFMDEATSHLDIANEALVNENINALRMTRILVAHRPETVRSAGRQINMADFLL
ncbi:MAG: peptidase domain-containing ABC transporter [Pseudomonadota bacterium]